MHWNECNFYTKYRYNEPETTLQTVLIDNRVANTITYANWSFLAVVALEELFLNVSDVI